MSRVRPAMPRREPKLSPEELCPTIMDKPPLTDLRPISRDVKRCVAVVVLKVDWDSQNDTKWLILGSASIVRRGGDRHEGQWSLQARMDSTDFEHDSAYVLQLPLIGLQLDGLAVYNHHAHFVAWVDPNNPGDFHVPSPGYDPRKEEGAHRCKHPQCLKDDKGKKIEAHIVVPEGFYVPPFNLELYKMVRGKKVEIRMGPVFEDPDDNE